MQNDKKKRKRKSSGQPDLDKERVKRKKKSSSGKVSSGSGKKNRNPKKSNGKRKSVESHTSKETQKMTIDKKVLNVIGNILFYGVLLVILGSAVLLNFSDKDANIFGYKIMTVLTDSMKDKGKTEYKDGFSKGSLVFIKNVDPYTLEKGDIITFNPVRDNKDVYLTHRVHAIDEKKKEERVEFITTKGDANTGTDVPIAASQVYGRVVKSFKNLGFFLTFIKKHIVVVAILVSTLFGIIATLKYYRKV